MATQLRKLITAIAAHIVCVHVLIEHLQVTILKGALVAVEFSRPFVVRSVNVLTELRVTCKRLVAMWTLYNVLSLVRLHHVRL